MVHLGAAPCVLMFVVLNRGSANGMHEVHEAALPLFKNGPFNLFYNSRLPSRMRKHSSTKQWPWRGQLCHLPQGRLSMAESDRRRKQLRSQCLETLKSTQGSRHTVGFIKPRGLNTSYKVENKSAFSAM